jgi:hypothetical protein
MVTKLVAKRPSQFFLEREGGQRVDGYIQRGKLRFGPFTGAIIDEAMGPPMRGGAPSQAGDIQRTESWHLTVKAPLVVPPDSPDGTPGDVITPQGAGYGEGLGRDIVDATLRGEFRILRVFPLGPETAPVGWRCVLERLERAA